MNCLFEECSLESSQLDCAIFLICQTIILDLVNLTCILILNIVKYVA